MLIKGLGGETRVALNGEAGLRAVTVRRWQTKAAAFYEPATRSVTDSIFFRWVTIPPGCDW